MEFKEAVKYSIIAIASIGVIGLIVQLFVEGSFRFGSAIEASHDFGRLNGARIFLLAWETFWLSSIAIFFIYVAQRAKSGKSEEEIQRLEDFEPLLFKVVIGGLILAALITLLLPAFFATNLVPHYNQNDDGTEIPVVASAFQFSIDGNICQSSDQPEASCVTFNTDKRYIFLLESTDTTHGFTIYDDNNVLLMQAQIVPGYVTRLAFTFEDAGEYSIRCAEYCGAGHHLMLAAFTVVDGGSA